MAKWLWSTTNARALPLVCSCRWTKAGPVGFSRERARSNDCFRYESLTDREVKLGALNRFGAIVIPDQSPPAILNGHRSGAMPAEYTGGLGQEGVKAMREFVEQGGTLVFLNRASNFAIEQFKLPVRNVVAGVSQKDSLCRDRCCVLSSIRRIRSRGMSKETIAWVEDSPVFEVAGAGGCANVARRRALPIKQKSTAFRLAAGRESSEGKSRTRGSQMGNGRIILLAFALNTVLSRWRLIRCFSMQSQITK